MWIPAIYTNTVAQKSQNLLLIARLGRSEKLARAYGANGRNRFTTVSMRPKMDKKAIPKMAVYGKVSVKMRQNRRRLSKLLLIVLPLFFGKV